MKHIKTPQFIGVVIIIASLVLNGLVPAVDIDAGSPGLFKKALKSQSVLAQVFSFSMLPVKIVDDLYEASQAQPLTENDKSHQEREQTGTHNTAAGTGASRDYTITNSIANSMIFAKTLVKSWTTTSGGVISNLQALPQEQYPKQHAGSALYLMCLFLMLLIMIFSLLPRGAIDPSSITMFLKDGKTHPGHRLAGSRWVFSFKYLSLMLLTLRMCRPMLNPIKNSKYYSNNNNSSGKKNYCATGHNYSSSFFPKYIPQLKAIINNTNIIIFTLGENLIKNSLAKAAASIIFEKSSRVFASSCLWFSSINFIAIIL